MRIPREDGEMIVLESVPPCRKSHPSEGIISLPYMPPNFITEQKFIIRQLYSIIINSVVINTINFIS